MQTQKTTSLEITQNVVSFKPADNINGRSHRKEKHFNAEYTIVAFQDGKFSTPITLRLYGTDNTKYVCFWISGNGIYATGSGSANGYGYDKASAAAQVAINNAGIELAEQVEGRGMEKVKEALKAIAIHLGYKTFTLHYSHG